MTFSLFAFLPDGWLDGSKLGFCVGHIEGEIEGISAIKKMANMCWMKVLDKIKKEQDICK